MQPRVLALFVALLPLIAFNGVYLHSAVTGFVPWCMPYIDGCTTISRAARSGDALFWFRAVMMVHAVLLIWFWVYVQQWLALLFGCTTKMARVICWLGIIGALFLIVYVDFLGTMGEVNRFMRRFGIIIFFTFTPLAQLLLLNQHFKYRATLNTISINPKVLGFQLVILLLILCIGIISIAFDVLQLKSYESQNIVEWNYSLLLTLYFAGMIFLWKDFRYFLKNESDRF